MFGLKIVKESEISIDCPIQALGTILGKKWVGKILWVLKDEKKRYGELQRMLNKCSKKMLSQQLDLLIQYKIVINQKFEEDNKVESSYYLSDKGKNLIPIIKDMMIWGSDVMSC